MRALISHHNNCYNGLQRPVDAHNPYRTAVTDTALMCGASFFSIIYIKTACVV